MEKQPKWIFCDIDGTLLYARGVGRAAFRQAFQESLGWDQGVEHVNFFGATDLDVFRTLCAERGERSTPAMEAAFFDRLAPALDVRLAQTPPAPGRMASGAWHRCWLPVPGTADSGTFDSC
jgi:beta-phosphoglucomutase-like phosphatase (HAD superfamily)